MSVGWGEEVASFIAVRDCETIHQFLFSHICYT